MVGGGRQHITVNKFNLQSQDEQEQLINMAAPTVSGPARLSPRAGGHA